MTIAYRPKLGTELEYIGALAAVPKRRLEIVQYEALVAGAYRPDAPVILLGKNGRPRGAITLPGHGKGIKPRNAGKTFPPEPLTPAEILRMLAACPNTKAGFRNRALIALLWRTGAPLFCTIQRPGIGGRLHDAYVRAYLHKLGMEVGIPKRVHPHGFRHTLTCELVREHFPLAYIQSQLGHSSIATTAIYCRGLGADEAFDMVAEREWPGGAR